MCENSKFTKKHSKNGEKFNNYQNLCNVDMKIIMVMVIQWSKSDTIVEYMNLVPPSYPSSLCSPWPIGVRKFSKQKGPDFHTRGCKNVMFIYTGWWYIHKIMTLQMFCWNLIMISSNSIDQRSLPTLGKINVLFENL